MSIILRKLLSCPENLIYTAFVSVFLPFWLTAVVLVLLGFVILADSRSVRQVFSHNGSRFMALFTLYTAVVGLIRDNFLGVACSLGFFLIMILSYYCRSNITGDVLQRALDMCCWMSIVVFFSVFAERLIYSHLEKYRCVGWFFNSNYLGSMMALVIVVCAYKVIATHKGKPFYYIVALLSAVTMYLCGSILAIIEVIVGVLMLLILYKKHSVISAFLCFVAVGMIALYLFPEIFPRILESNVTTENRILVWDSAIAFIKRSPLFGHGFLSYYHLHNKFGSLWATTHAHNFALEPILSFGIIGTAIFLIFIWAYYEKISECKSLLRKSKAANLILAVSVATIVHCAVDLTILWIQNGLFFALLLSSIGVDEKTLDRRIKACAKAQNAKSSEEE